MLRRIASITPVLLFIVTASCSKQMDSTKIRISDGLAYDKDTGLLLSGAAVELRKNGAVKSVGYYKKGLKHGLFSSYYSNKRLYKKENFLLGKREGMFLTFHRNGRLKSKMFFENDSPSSELTLYNPNGKPTSTIPYDQYLPKD